MKDTGERMIPNPHKGKMIYGEHITRYEAVLPAAKDKSVLDIACGTGYGSQLLSGVAKDVVGVDVSEEAVGYAREHFSAKNLQYLVGDATAIPLKDESVDVVVSFETIEHVKDYRKFVAEAKRVLRPGGQFIVSTPNDDEYAEGNEFHVHEFKLSEIRKLLESHFAHVELYLQGTWLYTGLFDPEKFAQEWQGKYETIKTLTHQQTDAVYFVLVCSDSRPAHLAPTAAISESWSARHQREQDKAFVDLEQKYDKTSNSLRRKTEEAELLAAELSRIRDSRWYRMLRGVYVALRSIVRRVPFKS